LAILTAYPRPQRQGRLSQPVRLAGRTWLPSIAWVISGRPQTAIDVIAEGYLDDSAALDPVAATRIGIPGHDTGAPGKQDLAACWELGALLAADLAG
jgi:hypothetical protein